MGQAIITKYLGPTNKYPSGRIKATCYRGSVTIPYNHHSNPRSSHEEAAARLVKKLNDDADKEHGPLNSLHIGLLCNHDAWTDAACGELPDNSGYAFIFRLVKE